MYLGTPIPDGLGPKTAVKSNGEPERWVLAARLSRVTKKDRERGNALINGIQTQDQQGAEWARDEGHVVLADYTAHYNGRRPTAVGSSGRPGPTTLSLTSPRSRSSVGPSSAASSTSTSGLHRCPGQDEGTSARGGTGPDRAAGRRRVDQSTDRERAGCTEPTVIKWCRRYAEAGWPGWKTRRARGSPKTVLTEEVSDKPSDYGSRLQQTQRDVTRHRNSSDLR
jgi:hypothetical protein